MMGSPIPDLDSSLSFTNPFGSTFPGRTLETLEDEKKFLTENYEWYVFNFVLAHDYDAPGVSPSLQKMAKMLYLMKEIRTCGKTSGET